MTILFTSILVFIALLTISLERTYRRVPIKELKRRARSGDEVANILYRAVSYGPSLKIVLWGLIALTNTVLFVYLNNNSPIWFAFIATLAVIWFGFLWLPVRDVTRYGTWFAVKLAPFFGWLMEYIHPFVKNVGSYVEKHKPISIHTGLYVKEDLIDLIDKQKVQTENRIDKAELDMVKQVLKFGEKVVADYLIPRRQVVSISVEDSIGPVLMEEVHRSGHSRFPVYEENKDNIIGILYLRDILSTKEGGHVKKLVRRDIVYVHEEQSLYDVLQTTIKTKHHLFIVVNSFEEYVGVISIEDVLEQLVGISIVDEFDQYDDLRAVASKKAKTEHKQHNHVNANEKQTEAKTENIENKTK